MGRLRHLFVLVVVGSAPLEMSCSTVAGAEMLQPGSTAPSLRALDQTGRARTLEEFRGRPLVVFFYPKDGTPGCTAEACAFRDAWQRYEEAGVSVVGVSTDTVEAHARFADEHGLPFPLLADVDAAIAKAWGVGVTFGMTHRVSYLLDGGGRIARVFPDVDPGVHAGEVLAAAAALPTSSIGQPATP